MNRKMALGILLGFGVVCVSFLAIALGVYLLRATPVPAPPSAPSAPPAPTAATPSPAEPLTPDQRTVLEGIVEAQALARLEGDALVAALEDWSATAADVSYAQLERNAEQHRRERAVFTGRVLEVHDTPEGGALMRVALRSYGRDILWVEALAAPPEDIVQGRRVRVYGYLMGTRSYTSQAGWVITLPQLAAVAVVDARTPRRLTARRRE